MDLNVSARTQTAFNRIDKDNNGVSFEELKALVKSVSKTGDPTLTAEGAAELKIDPQDIGKINQALQESSTHNPTEIAFAKPMAYLSAGADAIRKVKSIVPEAVETPPVNPFKPPEDESRTRTVRPLNELRLGETYLRSSESSPKLTLGVKDRLVSGEIDYKPKTDQQPSIDDVSYSVDSQEGRKLATKVTEPIKEFGKEVLGKYTDSLKEGNKLTIAATAVAAGSFIAGNIVADRLMSTPLAINIPKLDMPIFSNDRINVHGSVIGAGFSIGDSTLLSLPKIDGGTIGVTGRGFSADASYEHGSSQDKASLKGGFGLAGVNIGVGAEYNRTDNMPTAYQGMVTANFQPLIDRF